MTFTKFLRKWFGLNGNLLRRADKVDENAEPWTGKGDFTLKGWNKWGDFLLMLSDMVALNLITEDQKDTIADRVWDIVFND